MIFLHMYLLIFENLCFTW